MQGLNLIQGKNISIHALREEGDCRSDPLGGGVTCISIHALREEGDLRKTVDRPEPSDFYPRPPRGGRQALRSTRGAL